jgi:hypothetical protein
VLSYSAQSAEFPVYFMQFGVKLAKKNFKFNFFYEIKYGHFFQNGAQNGKKVSCCQIVNFNEFQKLYLLKFASTCGYIFMLILNFLNSR